MSVPTEHPGRRRPAPHRQSSPPASPHRHTASLLTPHHRRLHHHLTCRRRPPRSPPHLASHHRQLPRRPPRAYPRLPPHHPASFRASFRPAAVALLKLATSACHCHEPVNRGKPQLGRCAFYWEGVFGAAQNVGRFWCRYPARLLWASGGHPRGQSRFMCGCLLWARYALRARIT
eukprot:scaffold3099_cov100-Isochrysis_galbana.AAC.2